MPTIQLPQFVKDVSTGAMVPVSAITSFKPFVRGTLDHNPRAVTQLGEHEISQRDYYLLTSPVISAHEGDVVYHRSSNFLYAEPVVAWIGMGELQYGLEHTESDNGAHPSSALLLSRELVFFSSKLSVRQNDRKEFYNEARIFKFAGNVYSCCDGEIHANKSLKSALKDLFENSLSFHIEKARHYLERGVLSEAKYYTRDARDLLTESSRLVVGDEVIELDFYHRTKAVEALENGQAFPEEVV